MDAQTYPLFRALGGKSADEGLSLVLALLEAPGTSEDVARRASVASATASRHLEAMALAGIVSRPTPRGKYVLEFPDETRKIIEALGELATAIISARRDAQTAMDKRIAKTRLRSSEESSAA